MENSINKVMTIDLDGPTRVSLRSSLLRAPVILNVIKGIEDFQFNLLFHLFFLTCPSFIIELKTDMVLKCKILVLLSFLTLSLSFKY